MRQLRRALRRGQGPQPLPRLPEAALGEIQPRRAQAEVPQEGAFRPSADHLALPGTAAGARHEQDRFPDGNHHAHPRNQAARGAFRRQEPLREGREPPADGQFQGTWHGDGHHDGQPLRHQARRLSHRRQRGRRDGGLRRARGHGGVCLHAGGHAGHQPEGVLPVRREDLPRQRPHHRLRAHRGRGQGEERLVRCQHAQGALSHRGQENDGPRTRRAVRLGAARRDPLPDRRRHGLDWHVEGLCRTRSARLA